MLWTDSDFPSFESSSTINAKEDCGVTFYNNALLFWNFRVAHYWVKNYDFAKTGSGHIT